MVPGVSTRCKHQRMRGLHGYLPFRPRPPRSTLRFWTFSLLSMAMVTVAMTVSGAIAGRTADAQNLETAGPPTPSSAGPTLPPGPSTTTTLLPTAGPTLEAPWTLAFGGDTLLTRAVAETTDPFAGIRPPLADADLAIVNLETAMSTRGRAQIKEFTFRSAPSFADRVAAAGIDVVSLANNHTLDFGVEALQDTIRNLDRVNVAHVGAGSTLDEALTPAEFEINNVAVAVLGASQIIPDASWLATPTRAGIASAGKHAINAETQRLLDAVRRARVTNDVVVVILHWGIEGNPCPSPVQQELAGLLVDAGATAVLGAHPHVLQPIVRVPTPTGDAVIAYSMGNFIWDPRSGATADTGLLRLRFIGGRFMEATFHPHRLDRQGWARAVSAATSAGRAVSTRVSGRCPGGRGTPIEVLASA